MARLRVKALSRGLQLASLLALGACGGKTPLVEEGPPGQPRDGGTRVHRMPPPAKVEVIPLRRSPTCVWLDGYWDYRGGDWRWVKGAWIEPPEDCHYTPPSTRFEQSSGGSIPIYRRGEFYPDEPGGKCEAVKRCAEQTLE